MSNFWSAVQSRRSCLVSYYFLASHTSFRSFDSGSSCDSKAIEGGLGLVKIAVLKK